MTLRSLRMLALLSLTLTFLALSTESTRAQTPTLPSERPDKVEPTNYGFDYVRREVMIPMRDGVKLHTVILVPKGAKGAPILL
ncbi:MAG: CocE/NonD family hydrolase, partial [Pyrinomonadaceae bacterium]